MSDLDAPEAIDALLRRAFENSAVPTLSASFERRVARHVARGELTPGGRGIVVAYAAVALAMSIWTMRSVSIDWSLIAAAILLPVAVTAATLRRRIFG